MTAQHTPGPRPECIRDRLILAQDRDTRAGNTLARQGFHQRAAECRARARHADIILNWIDNGVPLLPPRAAKATGEQA